MNYWFQCNELATSLLCATPDDNTWHISQIVKLSVIYAIYASHHTRLLRSQYQLTPFAMYALVIQHYTLFCNNNAEFW